MRLHCPSVALRGIVQRGTSPKADLTCVSLATHCPLVQVALCLTPVEPLEDSQTSSILSALSVTYPLEYPSIPPLPSSPTRVSFHPHSLLQEAFPYNPSPGCIICQCFLPLCTVSSVLACVSPTVFKQLKAGVMSNLCVPRACLCGAWRWLGQY